MVSLYYYLMVIKQLYVSKPDEPSRLPVPPLMAGLTVLLVAGIFYVGCIRATSLRRHKRRQGPLCLASVQIVWATKVLFV